MRGFFFVIEGGDGAGKSTQVALLAQALRERGYSDVVVTREPGATEFGAAIRAALLHAGDVAPQAEALAYAADRADHVATVIAPTMARGGIVLSDRYLDSSLAYQAQGRGLGDAQVRAINAFGTGGLEPDLTILLDITPEAGAARRDGKPDRIERAGVEFHARVAQRYRELAAEHPERYLVLDASDSAEEIHEAAVATVLELLGR
ncbi:MAG: dTMP kinase [Micrococcales bacterium]|nr:dTMP kinase [Micrococcales bacterium]